MSEQTDAKQVDQGLPLTIWGVVAGGAIGILTAFKPALWIWATTFLWLILWLTALLKMLAPDPRTFLMGTLRKSTFTQVYTWAVKSRLDRLWDSLCDPVEDRASLPTLLWGALTWRLYDRALLIALSYPILLLTAQWTFGWNGQFGNSIFFLASPFFPDRLLVLSSVFSILLCIPISNILFIHTTKFWRSAFLVIPLAPFTIFTLFMEYFDSAFSLIFAPTIVLFFSTFRIYKTALTDSKTPKQNLQEIPIPKNSLLFLPSSFLLFAAAVSYSSLMGGVYFEDEIRSTAFHFFLLITLALFLVICVMLPGYLAYRCEINGDFLLARFIPIATLILSWVFVTIFTPWEFVRDDRIISFLYLNLLPVLNTTFDLFSYAITLTLVRKGLAARVPILWGALDFAIALILFFALGATLTAVIAGMNALAGTTIFDLGSLFDGIESEPNAYWWLYLMVFSTILPTALHFAVSLIGFQGITARPIRRYAANLLDSAPDVPSAAATAPIVLGTIWLVPFLAVGGLLWGLWRWVWLGDLVTWLGGLYFTTLKALAAALGAL